MKFDEEGDCQRYTDDLYLGWILDNTKPDAPALRREYYVFSDLDENASINCYINLCFLK